MFAALLATIEESPASEFEADEDSAQADADDFVLTPRELPTIGGPLPAARRTPPSMPLPFSIDVWLAKVASAQANRGETYPDNINDRILYLFDASRDQVEPGGLLRICKARVNKTGGYSGIAKYTNTQAYSSPPRYMLQSDIHALRLLSAATGRGYSFEFPMAGIDADMVRAIVNTGRAFWQDTNRKALRWMMPRQGHVEWRTLINGDRQPAMVTVPAAAVLACVPPVYVDAETGECGTVESALTPAVAMAVASAPTLPAKWVSRVSEELQTRNLHQSIPLPTTLEEEVLQDFRPKPVLTLRSHKTSRHNPQGWKPIDVLIETAELGFDYLGVRVAGKNPPEITRVEGNRLQRIPRNTIFERTARARLVACGLTAAEKALTRGITREMQGTLVFAGTSDEHAFAAWTGFIENIVPALRRDGWQIDIAADFRFDIVPIADWYADVDESSNQWFDLEIGIEVEGEKVSLIPILVKLIHASPTEWRPAAVDAMKDDAKIIVPLGDGRRAALPLTRLKPLLATLFELYLREPTAARLRLSPLDAARLAEMDRALALRWFGGERMRQLGARLARFEGIAPVPVPPGFHATLRAYQQDGLAWLQFLREYELSGILADDMGLGKTVQTLAHLVAEKAAGRLGGLGGPALVVAPTSMMATWHAEAARFAPGLTVMVSHGLSRHDREETFADFDLVLTTYALLTRDEEKLLAQQWHLVILDEAQNIKNPKTKAATVACRLQARHRLCLTGTPMENHLGELWSLFRFLMPGLLGDEKTFKRDYRVPIEREGDLARQKFLARRVHPFLLRRTKDLVAHELPAKTLVTRAVEFDSAQADLYETVRAAMDKRVRDEIAAKGIAKSHIVVLDALLKLRQICCDPRLLKTERKGKPPASAKLVTLMEMLDELLAEGRSILLFSQFTSMLALIEAELSERKIAYAKLTGATRDRKKPIELFQSGEVKLFLISLKAGGTGLTLTAADTVIHYDPWWNPAVENQATDRAHRIGQVKPVFVYKLIAKGTLEERIVELQAKKGALAAGLLDGDVNAASKLDAKDLQALFEAMPG
ncbi:MAG: DEAD/DEAH box helicase [Betaproteobacteria bacterium]|nr:DEAD/DEAH box helicase [Betaproteobacteria bacterium]